MNTMHQTLFTARLTEEQPPRLAVVFTPGSGFKKDGMDCGTLIPKAGRHIKINLADRTVINEAAGDLASACNRGTFLAFRQVSQHNYAYEDDNEEGEIGTIAQVVLQVRNASLVAEFARDASGPVVPVMPGAGIVEEVVNVQPLVGIQAVAGASQDRLTGSLTDLTPVEFDLYARCFKYPEFSNMALYQAFLEKERALKESLEAIPAEVFQKQEAASEDKLTGSLTKIGIGDWYLYAECLKNPSLSYTAKYQEFLEKERALKESLEASPAVVAMPDISSQDKLTGSLTEIGIGEWYLYAECLKNPSLSYTAKYQQFLQRERALLNAQEVKNP